MLADELEYVVGVDPHRDTHAVAIVQAATGAALFEAQVAAGERGYAQALRLAEREAPGRRAWAIEGTGVPGWQVEHLVGPDDDFLALVGPDTQPSAEDNAPVIELARGGADLWLRMCLPAPARLQDMVADHRSGEAHLVGRAQRVCHHRLGLTQVADLDRAHGDPPPAAAASPVPEVRPSSGFRPTAGVTRS
jgi:hypothetical protein